MIITCYKQDKDLLTQLKPLSKELNILQKDFATVADSYYNVWMTLLKEWTVKFHHQFIKNNQALKPFQYLAYLMHPVYKGENFTTELVEIVVAVLIYFYK